MILAGPRMWTGEGVELPEEEGARGAAICQAELPILLMRLAREQLELSSPAEGVLIATGPEGIQVTINIGSDGLVRRITTPTQEQVFSEYGLQAGVMLPSRLEQSDLGQEPFSTELRNWQMSPAFPPERFEPPSD